MTVERVKTLHGITHSVCITESMNIKSAVFNFKDRLLRIAEAIFSYIKTTSYKIILLIHI